MDPSRTADTDVPRGTGIRLRRVAIGALVFVALTVAVFWYQFARIEPGQVGPSWSGLRWEFALLIVLAFPIEPFATTARIWVVCRVLQPGIRFWDCFKADAANLGFSMLTPSQSGGGPAQIYLLARAGAAVGTALTISLLSFLGTLAGLMVIGLYSLAYSDLGARAGTLFSAAVWTITASVGLMIVGALAPGAFRIAIGACSRGWARLRHRPQNIRDWRPPDADLDAPAQDRMGRLAARAVDLVYTYRNDVARFLRHGKLAFLAVVVLTLMFLCARALMAYLVVRFLGVDADISAVIGIQLALLFIIYFAPTPGGAGIAEGASLAAMAAIITPGFAPYYNLLWRFTTVYLIAIAGIIFTLRSVADDARKVIRAVRKRP